MVTVSAGEILPADVLLIEGEYLSVDQAALTGESLPVSKKVGDGAYSGSIAKQGTMTAWSPPPATRPSSAGPPSWWPRRARSPIRSRPCCRSAIS